MVNTPRPNITSSIAVLSFLILAYIRLLVSLVPRNRLVLQLPILKLALYCHRSHIGRLLQLPSYFSPPTILGYFSSFRTKLRNSFVHVHRQDISQVLCSLHKQSRSFYISILWPSLFRRPYLILHLKVISDIVVHDYFQPWQFLGKFWQHL